MAGVELYWMRFFAALRMTAGCMLRSSETTVRYTTKNPKMIIENKTSGLYFPED
jgi:hypothetical protein